MAELQVRRVGSAKQLHLGDESIAIGRSSENAVVLSDRTVSRRHCVIEVMADAVRVRDLQSRYGTKVNGKPVEQTELHDGDRVGVGPFELVVTGIGSAPPDRKKDSKQAPSDDAKTIPIAEDSERETEPQDDGDELNPDKDVQATDVAEIEQRERELKSQQEKLRTDRRKLRRERSKIKKDRQQLESERKQLETERAATVDAGDDDVAERDADAALETQRMELDEQRAAIESQRQQLDADRQALNEQQKALEQHRSKLNEREEAVQQREDDLTTRARQVDDRAAELAEQHEQLQARQAELDAQAQRDDAQQQNLESQLEEAQRELDDAMKAAEAKTDAAAAIEAQLEDLRKAHDELINRSETDRAELSARLETVESEREALRQQGNRAAGEFEQKAAQLEDAMKQTLELQQRVDELTHEHGLNERRLDRIDSAMRRLHEPTELLGVAAKRVATAQQRVAELEAQWVRCDSTFNSAVQASQQQQAEQALAERDRIAAELEEANAARDQAAEELRSAAGDVVKLVRAVPTGQDPDEDGSDSGTAGASRRKWFARKR